MSLNAEDLAVWREYETLTIEDGGLLLYGIEPCSFRREESEVDHGDAARTMHEYFRQRGGKSLPFQEKTLPQCIEQFYDRGGVEDVAHFCELIESAALGDIIDIASRVLAPDGRLNWKKTLLKKSSFIRWVRHRDPGLAAALSSSENTEEPGDPDGDDVDKKISSSEWARRARKNHDMHKERGCRRLILENWDRVEELHGPHANGRQVQKIVARKLTVDDQEPQLKTYQNQLRKLRLEKLIP